MKDLYSFHTDETEMEEFYEKATESYKRAFDRVGIGDKTYLTFASGGTFSKYSHEFQTVTPAGEDAIFICDKCRIAINKEVMEDVNYACPQCSSKDLREDKAIEVGNIFKMKDKYSAPLGLKFKDSSGVEKNVLMGCYGFGISRVLGAVVEASHDDKGIIWPETIAPFKYHLLEQNPGEAKEVYEKLINEIGRAHV
jgi:prolyl-tRNA synthetase